MHLNRSLLRYPIYIQLLAAVVGLAGLLSCGGGAKSMTPPPTLAITNPDAAACGMPPCALTSGTEGSAYSFPFAASSGVPPYTWSTSGGTALPSGLSLGSVGCGSNVNCNLQGTPAGESYPVTHKFTLTVTDSASNQASLAVSLTLNPSFSSKAIPATFFGMHINRLSAPWPVVAVGAQRLHDSSVTWAEIETQQGIYDFTLLDKWIAQAQANGADLLYTFIDVPQFYSSDPTDTTCFYTQHGNGACDPPAGLNSDGTGNDDSFKNFVTALANHVGPSIKYWELWNEPTYVRFWKGTPQQLVRMAQDAACVIKGTGSGCTAVAINPNAQMLTPAPAGGPIQVPAWMGTYLDAGGGQYADVTSFHGYVTCPTCNPVPTPEVITSVTDGLNTVLVSHGQQQKPIFDSEGSWGNTDTDHFDDPDLRSAFTARWLVLQQSAGIERVYWYRWDVGGGGGNGTLWDSVNTNQQGCNGSGVPYRQAGFLCQPGTAYEQVYNWLIGATLSAPCAANGTVWVCGYTRPNGYQAQIVWDTSQTCSSGSCTTSAYTPAVQYTRYRDLAGVTTAIGGTVPVGAKAVIIETGAP